MVRLKKINRKNVDYDDKTVLKSITNRIVYPTKYDRQ